MSPKNVLAINDLNFDAEVLPSPRPFVLAFGAPWCGPCRLLSPIIEQLAGERPDSVRVGKVDIDESPELARVYQIRGVPTVAVFWRGHETARHLGVCNRQRLLALLETGAPLEPGSGLAPERSADRGEHEQPHRPNQDPSHDLL
jgi:thioredoxin 1